MCSIKIKYTSPAIPQYPYDVALNAIYVCKKDKDKYIIKGANFEREFPLSFIKNMFSPIGEDNWDMLNPPKTKKKDSIHNDKNIKNKKPHIQE